MEAICIIFLSPVPFVFIAVQQVNVFLQMLDVTECSIYVSIVTVYSVFLCLEPCVNKLLHLKVTCLYFPAKEISPFTSLLTK